MNSHFQARILRLLAALVLMSASPRAVAQDAPPAAPTRPTPPKAAPKPTSPELPDEPDEPTADEPTADEPRADEPTAVEPAAIEPEVPPLRQAAPEEPPPKKTVAQREPARCSPAESRKVLAATRAALARVEAPVGSALGFVFHSRAHVLTTFEAVRAGRGVRVTLTDGIERSARIVSVDRENNLALLEIDSPSRIAPLTPGAALEVGDPLLLLTRSSSYDEVRPNQDLLVPGTVISRSAGRIRSNALDTRHATYGAPLLDCNGRLAAVAADMYSDEALLLSHAPPLVDAVGRQPEYRGDWSLAHPSFGGVFQYDRMLPNMERIGAGMSLGTALIGEDQWYFPLRLSMLAMGQARPPDADTVTRMGLRLQLEAGFGYRFMLTDGEMPLYLTPTIGAVGGYERWWEEINHNAITQSPCSTARPCEVQTWKETRTLDLGYIRPTVGVALQLGFAELGYQLMLDVEQPDRSTHQWYLGLQF